MVIIKSVDLSEEHDDRIRITEWEICILEYLFEEIRQMISTRETIKSLDIEIGSVLIHKLGIKKSRPSILFIVTYEKTRFIPELSTHTILIIHELIDESIRNLINLTFWIWYFTDKDITTGVYTVFGSGIEHFKQRGYYRERLNSLIAFVRYSLE